MSIRWSVVARLQIRLSERLRKPLPFSSSSFLTSVPGPMAALSSPPLRVAVRHSRGVARASSAPPAPRTPAPRKAVKAPAPAVCPERPTCDDSLPPLAPD